MARRIVRDDVCLVAVRAAYAALILGLVVGLAVATGVLSRRSAPPQATVAGALGIDVPGDDIDRRRAEAAAVLVSRCMTRHGFAWAPWIEPPPAVPDPDLGPVAWAERWGFGISTLAAHQHAVEPGDPNLTALGALGPDARDEARRALFGDRVAPGCQVIATEEVYGLRARLLAPLRPALDELDARVAGDPAAIALVSTWRSCVAPLTSGMTVDRDRLPERVMAAISDRLAALGETPAAVAGRAAIVAEERHAATVLAGCEETFSTARAVVAAPYEASFTREHGDALRRVGAEIRMAEAALPTMPP